MTRIDFYTHTPDKLLVGQKLIHKAWEQGNKIWVRAASEAQATQLDEALWAVSATTVIPHCLVNDPLANRTPVIIDPKGQAPWHFDCLINFHSERFEYFARFHRVLEIVSLEEEDRQQARLRFQYYRDRGFEIHSHDLSRK